VTAPKVSKVRHASAIVRGVKMRDQGNYPDNSRNNDYLDRTEKDA